MPRGDVGAALPISTFFRICATVGMSMTAIVGLILLWNRARIAKTTGFLIVTNLVFDDGD